MKISYKPKTTGYIAIIRNFQELLKNKDISFAVLGAYVCFVLQADWDRKHSNYRVILTDDSELAILWNCSVSTISRNRKKLLEVGLLEQKGNQFYIKNFSLFEIGTIKAITKKKISKVQEYYARAEEELTKTLFDVE